MRFLVKSVFSVALFFAVSLTHGAQKLNFNLDWKFIRQDVLGAEQIGFDEFGWKTVSAPHTYNDVDTFDDWSPQGHKGETNQWDGKTWYRKTFDVPKDWTGKKVFIEFEAVRQVAEVYINGTYLGKSENGFIPFGFDLSEHLHYGSKNVLAVMCDNSFIQDETGKSKWSVYEGEAKFPWNNPHWHPAQGGIYRNVFLHVTDKLHITLPLYSNLETTGTYVYTPEVSKESAVVGVEAEVYNEYPTENKVQFKAEVLDAENRIVGTVESTTTIAANKKHVFKGTCKIQNPYLWEPAYPYLYTVKTSVFLDGRRADAVETPLGIRYWEFTVKDGFFINGHHVKLHGWGQKSTDEWPGLGTAMPDWMHYYTLELMKDAGGNFVRWGHTAGGPAQLKSSDQLGLITIQPGVDSEGDLEGYAWDVRARAFRDMIIYYRNHPSILIWEGGNQAVSQDHLKQLHGYVDVYDPYGKRVYAHRRPSDVTIKMSIIEIGTQGSHKYPQVPVVEGEYDREESPRRVWDNDSPPDYGYKLKHKVEYQLTSEQYAVNQVSEYVSRLGNKSHCGGANWIFTDSTSGGRNDSEVTRASGEVDAVRLPKEAYYACQAMFRNVPQVHIIGHWTYPEDRETVKNVYVVSNCPEVRLFVNGKSLGEAIKSYRYLFTFADVKWIPGTIEAVGYDADGKEHVRQKKETVGKPVRLKMTAMTGPDGLLATGSDVVLIDVEAVDAEGRRHPTVQQRVDFEISGPGIWRGGYNSGKINSTNNTYLDIESGINRVSIRSTRKPGTITLTAKSEGLEPATITIESKPVKVIDGVIYQLPALPKQTALNPAMIPTQDEFDTDGSEQIAGKYFTGFSYSGYALEVPIIPAVNNGTKIYSDQDYTFKDLPEFLMGAEYIQLPNDEKLYQAVDLMDFTAGADGMLYIAHDDRLPRPAWLADQYQDTGKDITPYDAIMSLFAKKVNSKETIVLGSNRESGTEACTMYLVFFVKADSV